jgi:hypothetical protein
VGFAHIVGEKSSVFLRDENGNPKRIAEQEIQTVIPAAATTPDRSATRPRQLDQNDIIHVAIWLNLLLPRARKW